MWLIVRVPRCSWHPFLFYRSPGYWFWSPPPVFFLPVRSSGGGCNFVVYRESTTVQLAPVFFVLKRSPGYWSSIVGNKAHPSRFFLPVWSSSRGCNFVLYRDSSTVQLAPPFFFKRSPGYWLSIPVPPHPVLFLPVWSSSAGCIFAVYRDSTTVQLTPPPLFFQEESRVLVVDPPPSSHFFPQSGQAVEGVILWFIVRVRRCSCLPLFYI